MEIGEYEIFCLRTVNDLFTRAKSKSREKFLTTMLLLEEDSGATSISCTQEAEFQELSTFIGDLLMVIKNPQVDKMIKSRMRLIGYCHIMQIDSVYQIISNLTNIMLNLDYSPMVYYMTRNNKRKNCSTLESKIEAIKKKVQPLDIPIDAVFEYLFYPKILDSFVNSKYLLSEGANLILTKKLFASTSSTVKRYFRYSELTNIFEKSLVFIKTFLEIYGTHMNEFRNGKKFDTLFGKVFFDKHRGWTQSNS